MVTGEKVTNIPVKSEKPRRSWLKKHRVQRMMDPFEDMDRLFDRLMTGFYPASLMRPTRWESPFRFDQEGVLPNLDLIDRGDEFLVRAEIPGVEKDDLEITLSDNTLTLRGKVSREEEKEENDYYCCETARGEMVRTIRLPAEVDGSKAKAKHSNGVVELVLPKMEVAKPKKIKVE